MAYDHEGDISPSGRLRIRPVEVRDAEAIHRVLLQPEVMPYVISIPSDRVESLAERYRTLPKTVHEMIAELDDVVVGHAGLVHMSGRKSHVGSFYIAVDARWHGQGVGTRLIETMLDIADNWLMLERVELSVLRTNPRAQALYERHGFVVEGVRMKAVKSAGAYVDEVMMGRLRPNGFFISATPSTN